jgi:hypothetical protein
MSEQAHADAWKERVKLDGWKVDRRCICADPQPATVGGHGYVMRVCLRCRRPVYAKGLR